MKLLPSAIVEQLEPILGTVTSVARVSGGMVNSAAMAVTPNGPVFIKWKQNAPPRLFECEADGLRRLREAGALRVPEVLHVGDDPQFLVLEWIEPCQPRNPGKFATNLAEGLAALHAGSANPDGRFGLEHDNYLGSLEQANKWTESWADFYRTQRLEALLALGRRDGWLSAPRARRVEQVAARANILLTHSGSRAELIHGDLWAGNFMCAADDRPVLIDPAVHYADREVELAFIQLFGGFPAQFMQIYNAAYPIEKGYEERKPLLQLSPLLVHLRHFGEEYGPWVDSVLDVYLG